jgi:UDP-N-acetylglucosamine acyltransferase
VLTLPNRGSDVSETNTIIHPTAIVHKDAKLGAGVQVGPYAIIDAHVTMGDGCSVGPHGIVTGHTTMGRNNRVFSHAVIGSEPQDVKYNGEVTYLEIGDDNLFREYVTINPGTGEGSKTVIGDDNWFLVSSHLGHNSVIGSHCKFVNEVAIGGHVRVDDYATIGGSTPVHQYVRIGKYAMIGGGLRVPQDVAPFTLAGEEPLRSCGLNQIGLERNGFSPERVKILKEAYRVVFRKKLTLKEAIAVLKTDFPQNEDMVYYIEFLETSTRGLTR